MIRNTTSFWWWWWWCGCLMILGTIQQADGQLMISYGMRRLALSLNQFGLDMLRAVDQLQQPDNQSDSFAFCPFCIGSSLAMLMTGLAASSKIPATGGDSLYESLRYALYLNSMQQQEINLAFLDLMRHLRVNLPDEPADHLLTEPGGYNGGPTRNQMALVNQVYMQRYMPIDYQYYLQMQQYYHTPIRTLDFRWAPEESRQHINAMVALQTRGRIKDLIAVDGGNNTVRFLFLSALYFRGRLDFRVPSKSPSSPAAARVRRGTFPRLWPLRSPLFQLQPPAPAASPVMVHSQPGASYLPPGASGSPLPFGPPAWMMGAVAPTTIPPPITTTIKPTEPTISSTSMASPVNHHHQRPFDPFEPFPGPLEDVDAGKLRRRRHTLRLRYQHSEYLNATVVEMPFVGGVLSMLAIVPDQDGPSAMALTLSRLNAQLIIDLLQGLDIRRITVTVPIMNITGGHHGLRRLFLAMGLTQLLRHPDELDVQYPPMDTTSSTTFEQMLTDAMELHHRTVLDVDIVSDDSDNGENQQFENLDTAAEILSRRKRDEPNDLSVDVTSPTMRIVPKPQGGVRKPFSIDSMHIRLDRKCFIFFILDQISGLILAIGRHQASPIL